MSLSRVQMGGNEEIRRGPARITGDSEGMQNHHDEDFLQRRACR